MVNKTEMLISQQVLVETQVYTGRMEPVRKLKICLTNYESKTPLI